MIDTLTLTPQMIMVLAILGLAVFLFVSEVVRIDIAAVSIMMLLGVLASLPGNESLLDTRHLFDGFASNAVISIIAVMIIGAGLDKTGAMNKVARLILQKGGQTESRLIPLIAGTVAAISSFMQNVGAAALFIPVVARISAQTKLPMSRLLMPMGFCAILGGTMTMIGSSPLIMLNDLILNFNASRPDMPKAETFSLFSATPVGLALVLAGIAYFVVLGRFVLPGERGTDDKNKADAASYFSQVYGLDADLIELEVLTDSDWVDKKIIDVQQEHRVRIVADQYGNELRISPVARNHIKSGSRLAVFGQRDSIARLAKAHQLRVVPQLEVFQELLASTNGGLCEILIPPKSHPVGKTFWDLHIRDTYRLSPVLVHRADELLLRDEDIVLQAGDIIVAFIAWEDLNRLESNRDFVVLTSEYPKEELRPRKIGVALLCLVLSMGLALFTDMRLSLALMLGALGMILGNVLKADEAYQAVSWQTIFLLASLMPLGQAVQNTGTAQWIATQTLGLLGDVPIWVLQTVVAILATAFTLVMSNVGATVLLVPLAMSLALEAGADPAAFALTVAIATSNSFLIPTHQVNVLIMGPGGYKGTDYLKAGSLMTVLFLVVALLMMNWVI